MLIPLNLCVCALFIILLLYLVISLSLPTKMARDGSGYMVEYLKLSEETEKCINA